MVHLGLGAFHRAHQAVYTEESLRSSGGDWGILSASLRHADVPTALGAQQQLYTVETLGDPPSYQVVACTRTSLTAAHGKVTQDSRIWVSIDWSKAPSGRAAGEVTVSGAGRQVTVKLQAFNPGEPASKFRGFVEGEGIVSMEAEHFTANQAAGDRRWLRIQDYGRTLSGMRAAGSADAAPATPDRDSPHLEYEMYLFDSGSFDVSLVTAPTLNFMPGRGLDVAISLDDDAARMIEVVRLDVDVQDQNRDWAQSVENNARTVHAKLDFTKPGYHRLKIWMIDPGVVLEKIVVNAGGLRPSYLGPPESFRWAERSAR
jgi:Gylcosyl hydrolase family 115 C-terminal domain/Mannitol dehydrogenase Rossmann domain